MASYSPVATVPSSVREETVESSPSTPAPVVSKEFEEGISEGPIFLEVAWEVARKVGGIYTVLRTKVPYTTKVWKDRYGLVGIYNPESASMEFEPVEPRPITAKVISNVEKKYNCKIHFGRWLIPGYPRVFLFDLRSSEPILHKTRSELMPNFARPEDHECNESIIFGMQVYWLLHEFVEVGKQLIVHFHEWQAAVGLLLVRRRQLNVATVFTTHATLLGRWLCSARQDLYNIITNVDVNKEAGNRQIYHRHWIEREAAHCATVFTTVSDITAFEASHILERKVDVIVPNGLNVQKFTALHTFQNLHAQYKEVIHQFIRGHFYGTLDFDLDKTLCFFTAGRYEYFNKGVDVFIDSLARLNEILKREGSDITVVAFIIMPAKTNQFNVESLKGQTLVRDLKITCDKIVSKLSDELFQQTLLGEVPNTLAISKEDEVMLKRRVHAMKGRDTLPPIVTHNMVEDANDEILNHLRSRNLFNRSEDRVKIIFHPEFLSSTGMLLPLDYPEFVRGCHLGIFPSYYEPWGYTPAECTVLGVPSLTSDLTGFANFMTRRVDDPAANGIFIVGRRFKSYDETIEQTTNVLWRFCSLSRRERIELRNRTERLSEVLDWKHLGKNYSNAWKMAFRNQFQSELGAHMHVDADDE